MLKPGVGYVDMTRGFNYTTTDELIEASKPKETSPTPLENDTDTLTDNE